MHFSSPACYPGEKTCEQNHRGPTCMELKALCVGHCSQDRLLWRRVPTVHLEIWICRGTACKWLQDIRPGIANQIVYTNSILSIWFQLRYKMFYRCLFHQPIGLWGWVAQKPLVKSVHNHYQDDPQNVLRRMGYIPLTGPPFFVGRVTWKHDTKCISSRGGTKARSFLVGPFKILGFLFWRFIVGISWYCG